MAKDKSQGLAVRVSATDPIDKAIDQLSLDSMSEDEKRLANIQSMAAQLNAEEPVVALRHERPKDIWTIDRMKKKEPTWADVYEDETFMVLFMPILGDTYCQERYNIAEQVSQNVPGSYVKLQVAYAEILWYCLKDPRCSWPLMETETDANGDDLYDEAGNVIAHTLPLTWDNILRFDMDMLITMLNSFQRAITGEVSGKR